MQILDSLKKYFNNTPFEIYLIYILPISLIAGSLVTNLNVLLLIIFYLFKQSRIVIYEDLKDKFILFLFVILIYLILNSIFIAENITSHVRAFGFIKFILLTMSIVFFLKKNNDFIEKKIILIWAIIFGIVSADLIFEFIFGFNSIGYSSNYSGRLSGFKGDEMNIGGYYFGFSTFVLLFFFDKQKLFFLSLLSILGISLLIGERSNLIKILILYLTIFFIFYDISLKKKLLYFFVIIFSMSLFISSYPNFKSRFYHHIAKDIDINSLENTIKTNQYLLHYSTAYEVFRQNKLFGVGIKNYRNVSTDDEYQIFDGRNGGTIHPHQVHFEFLSELGILGYILIIGYFVFILSISIKKYILSKNINILVYSLFIIVTLIPILPSGSFFTTYGATMFWINCSFLFYNLKK